MRSDKNAESATSRCVSSMICTNYDRHSSLLGCGGLSLKSSPRSHLRIGALQGRAAMVFTTFLKSSLAPKYKKDCARHLFK